MSGIEMGYRPEGIAPVAPPTREEQREQRPRAASETEQNHENSRWERPTAQAAVLLGGLPEDGKEIKGRRARRLKKIGTGEKKPHTRKATKASRNERDDYWNGEQSEYKLKTSAEQKQIWTDSANAWLKQFKDTPQEEFFRNSGISLDAEELARTFKEDWHGQIDSFAKQIVKNNNPQQIEENMEIIQELAKMYGAKSSDIAVLLTRGISNAKDNPTELTDRANEGIKQGVSPEDIALMDHVQTGSDQWTKKVKTQNKWIKQQRRERWRKARENWPHNKIKRKLSWEQPPKLGETTEPPQPETPEEPGKEEQKDQPAEPEAITDTEAKIKKAKEDAIATLNKILKREDTDKLTEDDKEQINKGLFYPESENAGNEQKQLAAFRSTLEALANDPEIHWPNAERKKDNIEEWITHELTHFRKAAQYGLNPRFEVQLEKTNTDKYKVRVSTGHDDPPSEGKDGKSSEQIRQEIFSAPGIAYDPKNLGLEGMSRHDLAHFGLYKYTDENDALGTPADAVTKAQEYVRTHKYQIDAHETVFQTTGNDSKEHAKRQLCFKIAQKLQADPTWEINPSEL